MADIFLSYASVDRPTARQLADALEACGWSVWWDHRSLRGGQHFDRIIEEAISTAKVVIVVWSKTSVESGWVRDEALLALEEEKLVPLRIDEVHLPLRFKNIHTVDLVSWTGDTEAEPFERLVEDLSYYLSPRAKPTDDTRRFSDGSFHASVATGRRTSTVWLNALSGGKRVGRYFAAVAVVGGTVFGALVLSQREQAPTKPPVEAQAPTKPPAETQAPTKPPVKAQAPTKPPVETQAPTKPSKEEQVNAEQEQIKAIADQLAQMTAELPAEGIASPRSAPAVDVLGMKLSGITLELCQQFNLNEQLKGVLVTEVSSGSMASERGLRPGDVINEVAQEEVSTPQDVAAKVKTARDANRRTVLLLIDRHGDLRFTSLGI